MLIIGLQKSKAGELEVPSSCFSSMKVCSPHCSPSLPPFRGCLVYNPCMH